MNKDYNIQENSQRIEDVHLKPTMWPFLFPSVCTGFVVSALLSVGAYFLCVELNQPKEYSYGAFIVLFFISLLGSIIAYRKENYTLLESTIVSRSGGIVSDQTSEIEIKNITHVKLRLPWLKHKFFGIGTIVIESAGTDKPAKLSYLTNAEAIYEQLWARMQNNGYDLTQDDLLLEKKPSLLGIFLDSIKFLIVFVLALTGYKSDAEEIFGDLKETISDYSTDLANNTNLYINLVIALIVLAALCYLILRIVDFRKREYKIFNDVVTYKEGFLTKNWAFIPYENISDASSKQNFLARLFGLYNVMISCQGSESEIKFNFLRKGPEVSKHIDSLVISALKKPEVDNSLREEKVSLIPTRKEPELAAPEDAWLATLKINGARYFIPLLLILPLFPLWILLNIKALIVYLSTTYSFSQGSVGHSMRFLTTVEREFAYEKITGLVIKRNLFDLVFSTATLKFWSIGSKDSMEIAHVNLAQIDLGSIMKQIGIPQSSEKTYNVVTKYDPISWMRAHCYKVLFIFLFVLSLVGASIFFKQTDIIDYDSISLELDDLASPSMLKSAFVSVPIIVAIITVLYFVLLLSYLFLYYKRQRLAFNEHHVTAQQGLITQNQYFVRYKNIKQVSRLEYPLGNKGDLEIFVAAEELVFNSKQQKENPSNGQQLARPCSFNLNFIPNVFSKGGELDAILSGRIEIDSVLDDVEPLELVLESKKSVSNSLVRLVIFSVIFIPAIAFLPLSIPICVLRTRSWRYRVEAGLIKTSHGILFKSQASILLDRVDSIQHNQGALGKLFGNGNVSIMTAGSSRPDMTVKDTKPYKQIYQEVKRLSQSSK